MTGPGRGVVFGAGAVGRGFIGELLLDAGWHVTFVDASPELVAALRAGWYPHDTVSSAGTTRKLLTGCTAVLADDVGAVRAAVTAADVVFTSVGARNLRHVAPALAGGLRDRHRAGRGPLDVFLAENLHDGPAALRALLEAELDPAERAAVLRGVGVVATSIGRMVPVPTPAQRAEHAALVAVEPYRDLPFDVAACRAPVPDVPGLVGDPLVPFAHYGDRKLWVHNQGHGTTAYLGALARHATIAGAVADPRIARVAREAMEAAADALAVRDGVDAGVLAAHVDDLLERFANAALADTVERVGRDPERKLAPGERFLGALAVTAEFSDPGPVVPGIALAAHRLVLDSPGRDAAAVLVPVRAAVSAVAPGQATRVDALVRVLLDGADLGGFLAAAGH